MINLLHARQDLEAERLWMSIIHQLLELFTRKTAVFDYTILHVVGLILIVESCHERNSASS